MKFKRRFVKKFKYNYKTRFLIPLFVLVCVALGLGYAYLRTDLSIVGVTKLKDNEWNVHFDNIQPVEGSVTPTTAPAISELTTVSFAAQLENPGDKYEFYIDVVNSGTIDAQIGSIIMQPELSEDDAKYFNYELNYDSGFPVRVDDVLLAGRTRTIKVSFKYLENADTTNYPDEDKSFSISVTLGYVQSDGIVNPCTSESTTSYENGQYSYSYNSSLNGWSVGQKDRSSTDPVTTKLCTSINGQPIVSMSGTFANSNATSIDLSSFNTKNVVNMSGMFYNAKVTNLDFSSFDTSKVTDMNSMFTYSSATSLDLRSFDTSSVTNMNSMFRGNIVLTDVYLNSFNTKNVTNMSNMFNGASSITELNLSSFDTKNVTDMSNMFTYLINLKQLDLSSFNTSNVTNMSSMFSRMSSLETLILDNFDFSNYQDSYLLYNLFDKTVNESIINLSLENAKLPTNCHSLFYGVPKVKILNLKNVDTSAVTNMSYMFYFGANNELEELDLSSFNTSNVTNMQHMFKYVPKVKELDLSNFDITNVETSYFDGIFDGVNSLEKLNLSGFDLSAFENTALSGFSIMYYNLSELVTPKDLRIGSNSIQLGNRMYAKGDSVGITEITKDTPTNTLYKSQPWN